MMNKKLTHSTEEEDRPKKRPKNGSLKLSIKKALNVKQLHTEMTKQQSTNPSLTVMKPLMELWVRGESHFLSEGWLQDNFGLQLGACQLTPMGMLVGYKSIMHRIAAHHIQFLNVYIHLIHASKDTQSNLAKLKDKQFVNIASFFMPETSRDQLLEAVRGTEIQGLISQKLKQI